MYIIKGQPSINDVTHFMRFLNPPTSLSPILLNRLMEKHHLLVDPPSSYEGDVNYGWPLIMISPYL